MKRRTPQPIPKDRLSTPREQREYEAREEKRETNRRLDAIAAGIAELTPEIQAAAKSLGIAPATQPPDGPGVARYLNEVGQREGSPR